MNVPLLKRGCLASQGKISVLTVISVFLRLVIAVFLYLMNPFRFFSFTRVEECKGVFRFFTTLKQKLIIILRKRIFLYLQIIHVSIILAQVSARFLL